VAAPATPPGRWLNQPADGAIHAQPHLRGFGGLHGGLTLALLTRAMQQDGTEPGGFRSATARFYHPIIQTFTTRISRPRRGRVTAEAVSADPGRSVVASASLVTSAARSPSLPPVAPRCPLAPPATECERFVVPAEFVPISAFMDVRPVGTSRPYAGGAQPELTAWLRLTEDDQPPDLHRLILLMDALAPSYAAILTSPRPIPTVELTVRTADSFQTGTSPWILLHARTVWASPDGWLHEHLDAWDPAGNHLASADQLRAVASTRTTPGGGTGK
jgi:hypothetical protein